MVQHLTSWGKGSWNLPWFTTDLGYMPSVFFPPGFLNHQQQFHLQDVSTFRLKLPAFLQGQDFDQKPINLAILLAGWPFKGIYEFTWPFKERLFLWPPTLGNQVKGHGLKVTWNFLRPCTGRLVGLDHLLDHYHLIHEPHEGASLRKSFRVGGVFDTVIPLTLQKDLLKADRKKPF